MVNWIGGLYRLWVAATVCWVGVIGVLLGRYFISAAAEDDPNDVLWIYMSPFGKKGMYDVTHIPFADYLYWIGAALLPPLAVLVVFFVFRWIWRGFQS